MVSQKVLQRRAVRQKAFHTTQGPFAVHHDKRTWADNNGGKVLEKGEAALLKMYPVKRYPFLASLALVRRFHTLKTDFRKMSFPMKVAEEKAAQEMGVLLVDGKEWSW